MDQENLVIICEIFKTVLNQQAKQILTKMNKSIQNYQHFEQLEQQVNQLVNNGKSVISDYSLIESILVENLQVPKVNIFDYLLQTQQRTLREQSLTWNQQNQERMKFFSEILQIIQNYIVLAVNTPELFPEGNFFISQKLFQNYTYDKQVQQMLQLAASNSSYQIIQQLYSELSESRSNLYELIKNAIQVETYNKVTLFDQTWDQCIDIIMQLLQIQDFKKSFMYELTKIESYQTARDIEKNCLYGYLLSNTIIPFEPDARMKYFKQQAVDKILQCKTKGQFQKTSQVNQKEYNRCTKKNI